MKATFTGSYYSSYSVKETFAVEISACTTDTITPSTINDKYYLVGSSQLDESFTAFTAINYCESIVYSLS